jgi:hypothetical protein
MTVNVTNRDPIYILVGPDVRESFFIHSDDEDASAGCVVNELVRAYGGFED